MFARSSSAAILGRAATTMFVSNDGTKMLDAAHRWQESVFDELTADWSADDVRRFHGYLLRFIGSQHKHR